MPVKSKRVRSKQVGSSTLIEDMERIERFYGKVTAVKLLEDIDEVLRQARRMDKSEQKKIVGLFHDRYANANFGYSQVDPTTLDQADVYKAIADSIQRDIGVEVSNHSDIEQNPRYRRIK